MKDFYAHEIGVLTRRNGQTLAPRWVPALLVYLLIPAGLVLFVRPLLAEQTSLGQVFAWGALFGLVLYGVYDFTNLAVLDKWTLRVTLVDLAWGTFLCGAGSLILRGLDRWLTI